MLSVLTSRVLLAMCSAKRISSPQKKPEPPKIVQVPKQIDPTPPTDLKTKKPKPEMKDAITQTDRSDYQIIKNRQIKENALR